MSCVARPIVVTDLLLVSARASPCRQRKDASLHKPTATSIYATALFGSQCEGAYVSLNFVEKALGPQIQVSRERSGICSTARVTWHLAILSQTTETSYLRVAYELDHDVVFGRRPGCSGWKNFPVNPQPLYSNRGSFQDGPLRMTTLVEHLAKLEKSKLDKQLADTTFIKASASSFGIGLDGELAIKDFAGLLRQRVEITEHGRQSPGSKPLLLAAAATSDARPQPEGVESLVSSRFDEGDLVYEGSTTSSEMTWEMNFHELLSSSCGTDRACTEDIFNTSMQAAQVTRGPSPSGSLRSWQLVENASATGAIEDDVLPLQTNLEGTGEHHDPALGQAQTSDFDMHPGHKVWEWDMNKQRWRRRGRSGLEKTDWFPESFA